MFGASLRAAGQLRVNGHLFMRSLSALGDASAVLCSGDGVGGAYSGVALQRDLEAHFGSADSWRLVVRDVVTHT